MTQQQASPEHQELTLPQFDAVVRNPGLKLTLSDEAKGLIQKCRDYLDHKIQQAERPIYGINTGFGSLCNVVVDTDDLEALQYNLIRSHACGMGEEVPEPIVRLMLLLKIKALSKGHSGVSVATVQRLMDFFNEGVHPVVYAQGSLGASGDLAPLAHLALPLIGEGEVNYKGQKMSAAAVHEKLGWAPVALRSKEGLALLNGTQFMQAYGLYILVYAKRLINKGHRVAALSLDGFNCRMEPFDSLLHKIRPHEGQQQVAEQIKRLIVGSEIVMEPKPQVQDPYSFRCIPQVHGASIDVLKNAEKVFLKEANAVTDNPNIFVDEDLILSGGNFHGQPLALQLDFMAIALAELASISERRTYLLISGQRDLPAFLAKTPGKESGMMIPQYTAASIVSQNKQFCTPASVDTIPSSNGQEDHVSMGANAAVKCLKVLENTRKVLGIELMAASQALHYREPLRTSPQLGEFLDKFREKVPVFAEDQFHSPFMQAAADFLS